MSEKEMRELDAWIAEHVMGFVWARDCADRRSDYPAHSKFKKGTRALVCAKKQHFDDPKQRQGSWDGWAVASGKEPLAPAHYYEVPHYTADRAAAMEVLEKCCEKLDLDAVTIFAPNKRVLLTWTVRTRSEDIDAVIADADTLPLAICLFAKKLYEKET